MSLTKSAKRGAVFKIAGKKLGAEHLLDLLFLILALAGMTRLFRMAVTDSADFHVYWEAAHTWIGGTSPYVYGPEKMGFVFKYPPWLIPVLFPFSFLGFWVSKAIWALLEFSIIGYAVRWLIARGVRARVAVIGAFLFWWMWMAHLSAGQFTLVLLGIGLWIGTPKRDSGWRSDVRSVLGTYLFSAKIFSMVSLVGIREKLLRPRPIVWGLGLFAGVHVLAALPLVIHGYSPFGALSLLYHGWAKAAASGGAELGEKIVRGQGNHGFTAGILRTLHVSALDSRYDVLVFLLLSVFFGYLWLRYAKNLRFEEQWAGWLALGVIVHPLAWHHSFVMAYPLCVFALDRAVSSRNPRMILLALLGFACIGIFIPQVLGHELVKPLELASVKSWGVVISGTVLCVLANRPGKRGRDAR